MSTARIRFRRWRPIAAAAALSLAGALQPACAAGAADAPAQRELSVCADPANLPYSDQREQGFENRIASLLAADLHATLHYSWAMQRRGFLRRTLNAGRCDVVIGLPAGLQGVAQTAPYYRSSYVFVTRSGLQLQGLDDPQLARLRIGLQAVGAEGANTPPAMALARRGMGAQVTGYPAWGEEADETPQARIVQAVAQGEIDVAIVWGPIAGFFAQRQPGALTLAPLEGDPRQPELAFRYDMALSVRRGDTALRDELQQILQRRQPEIQAILRAYGVPLSGEAGPAAGGAGAGSGAASKHSGSPRAAITVGQLARTIGD